MADRSIIRRCLFQICSRRKRKDETAAADAAADSPVYPTKALPKFLSSLNARSQRLLLDLGPVVGTNVTFFGEELGCKIHVEDLFKDIDRHVTEGKLEALPAFFAQRFSQEDGTWTASSAGTSSITSTKPRRRRSHASWSGCCAADGVLFALFNIVEAATQAPPAYTRYVVADRQNLQYRPYHAARGKQTAFEPPRYPAAVRAAAHHRTVPAEEQPPGSAVPQADRRDNHRRGRACQSSRC